MFVYLFECFEFILYGYIEKCNNGYYRIYQYMNVLRSLLWDQVSEV